LPFFYVIDKLWQGEVIDQLNEIFAEIVGKFCETARYDRTVLVAIIGNVDPEDVYDESAMRRMQEDLLMKQVGFSQEVIEMLTPRPSQSVAREDDGPSRLLIGGGLTADDLPPSPPIRRKAAVRRQIRIEEPEEPEISEAEVSDDESSEEHLSFEQLRAARKAAETQQNAEREIELESE
jgi:hypothetical protein